MGRLDDTVVGRGVANVIYAAMTQVPHVAAVEVHEAPGLVVAQVTARWYAWLTLGAMHRRILWRSRVAMVRALPAGPPVIVLFKP